MLNFLLVHSSVTSTNSDSPRDIELSSINTSASAIKSSANTVGSRLHHRATCIHWTVQLAWSSTLISGRGGNVHATGLGMKSHLVGGGKVDALDYAGVCDGIWVIIQWCEKDGIDILDLAIVWPIVPLGPKCRPNLMIQKTHLLRLSSGRQLTMEPTEHPNGMCTISAIHKEPTPYSCWDSIRTLRFEPSQNTSK